MGGIRNIIAGIFCCVLLVFSLQAQDSAQLREDIRILSADCFYGRGNAYQGERLAAEWIRDELKALPHLMPMGENGFQKYAFNAFRMEGEVVLKVDDRVLNPFTDYRIAPFSQTTQKENVPIVKVDASLLMDTARMENFLMKYWISIKRSVVYIDGVQWKNDKKYPKESIQKVLQSLQYQNPFQSIGIMVGVDELPVWGLSNTDFERNYALLYVLRHQLPKKCKKMTLSFSNEFYKKETQNICFAIDGAVHPDEFVVYTAHYDHLGCMGDSVIFHGAHDNASGTATVMDFARYYSEHQPAYTTVFLLFSGEESGLRGSKNFVRNPLIPLDKIKMLINLDMFCGGDDGIMVVNSTQGETKEMVDMMDTINATKHYVTAIKRRANAANSDHYYFTKHCPAIFIYTLGGKYGGYHNYTDTCENCGLNNYSAMFALILETLQQYLHN